MTLVPDTATPTVASLDTYRPALLRYCYRMLGSAADADDAVQETMVRAWRGLDSFEGRAPLEAWLYRIATNVCLNLLRGRRRRAMPMDVAGPSSGSGPLGPEREAEAWVDPLVRRDAWTDLLDPADAASERESVRLAFVAALQTLPPRQRAVLLLRDVLRWRTEEVAELVGSSPAGVKSALQRARATLAAQPRDVGGPVDDELLARYVDAFSRYDIAALVELLRDDATFSMPPQELWVRGRAEIGELWTRLAAECGGQSTFEPITVNGTLGCIHFRPPAPGAPPRPFAVHVLEAIDGSISSMHVFRDTVLAESAAALR